VIRVRGIPISDQDARDLARRLLDDETGIGVAARLTRAVEMDSGVIGTSKSEARAGESVISFSFVLWLPAPAHTSDGRPPAGPAGGWRSSKEVSVSRAPGVSALDGSATFVGSGGQGSSTRLGRRCCWAVYVRCYRHGHSGRRVGPTAGVWALLVVTSMVSGELRGLGRRCSGRRVSVSSALASTTAS
jgi:hypothetical protein